MKIYFESQPLGSRICGASCAVMILRSFGKMANRQKIWAALRQPSPVGGENIPTSTLTKFLCGKGLPATTVRAKNPEKLIEKCVTHELPAILCCRQSPTSDLGHFVVLVGAEQENIVVHDPELGPNHKISRKIISELFEPIGEPSELTSRVLIIIGKAPTEESQCDECGTSKHLLSTQCPTCSNIVLLPPASVTGCIKPSCQKSLLESIICSHCDRPFAA
jgi:hypothetical protein